MICSNCKRRLKPDARACLCGWTAAAEEGKRRIECAYSPCTASALVRVKTKTGWANLCYDHNIRQHTELAEKRCIELGLYTAEQKMEYCVKLSKGLIHVPVEREPGEDDEPPRRFMPGIPA